MLWNRLISFRKSMTLAVGTFVKISWTVLTLKRLFCHLVTVCSRVESAWQWYCDCRHDGIAGLLHITGAGGSSGYDPFGHTSGQMTNGDPGSLENDSGSPQNLPWRLEGPLLFWSFFFVKICIADAYQFFGRPQSFWVLYFFPPL